MKLTYIYHSCYCIETENCTIIIDFYKDTKDVDGYIYSEILNQDKKLYVLSTHAHLDHFNGEILNWRYKVKDITYILFKDILHERLAEKSADTVFLDKLEEFRDSNLFVKAYGSTDIGGSFYIETDNKTIFHAGDLNNWHWNEESTPEEIEEAEKFYDKELNILHNDVKALDIAMLPIDPRLGKDFMKGAQQFIDLIDVKFVAPMHFDEEYDKNALFEAIAKNRGCGYMVITQKGQSVNL